MQAQPGGRFRRYRFILCAAVGLAMLPAATAAASSGAGSGSGATVRLAYDVLPGLARLQATGNPSSASEMEVGLALQSRTADEERYYRALYDPSSSYYHRFLTPAQVGQRFGPDRSATAAVSAWLTSRGLAVDQVAAAGDWVAAHGPTAVVERAFQVRELSYHLNGIDFVANDRGPVVPAAGRVYSVVGLNSLQHFGLPAGATAPLDPSMSDHGPAGAKQGPNVGTTTPADLWSVYQQPPQWNGQGQGVAVIGEGRTAAVIRDLRLFERHFNLPQVPVVVHCVQGGSCGTDSTGDPEWDIDMQASTGMAPGVSSLHLYFSKTLADQDLDQGFIAWISDPNGPLQASASEGVCEQTPLNPVWEGPLGIVNINSDPSLPAGLALGDLQEPVLDQQLRHAGVEGRTLFASSGDTGFTCGAVILPGVSAGNGVLYNGLPSVDYPAASPYAVAVGGTVLYTAGDPAQRYAEYGWNFGGGGTADFEPAPPFQYADRHVVGRCLASPDGSPAGTGQRCRGVPDVAAQSGDVISNGYVVYAAGAPSQGGGTSLSSPLWMGMWARIQSAARPGGNGFADWSLYRVGDDPVAHAQGFYDVLVGDNGYPATPGWDYVTGFGTPRVEGLIHLIDGR